MTEEPDRRHTRRQVLTAGGAAALTMFSVAPSVTRAGETDYSWEDGGDTIQRTFDEDELALYVPYLRISRKSQEELIGVYGWVARSPDHDTDAYCYWFRYTHQDAGVEELGLLDRAVGVLATDAHLWDHEPAIVFVDPDSGEVDHVTCTGYHHYPIDIDGDSAPLIDDAVATETHVSLEVVDPWHHFMFDFDERGADVTATAALRSFLAVRDSWESRGVFDSSNPLAIDNPWSFRDGRVKSWWDESTWDARAARFWHLLGLRGAGQVEDYLTI